MSKQKFLKIPEVPHIKFEVYPRPNSPYYYMLLYNIVKGEVELRLSTKKTVKRDAINFTKNYIRKNYSIKGGENKKQPKEKTVEDMTAHYLKHYKKKRQGTLRKNHLSATKSVLNTINRIIGIESVKSLNTETSNFYINTRQKEGKANSTINREIITFRAALYRAYLDDFGLVEKNIKKMLTDRVRLQNGSKNKEYMQIDEFKDLYDELPEFMRLPVKIMFHTGCRAIEVRLLKWDDLKIKRGYFKVVPKESYRDPNPAAKYIYLTKECCEELNKKLADCPKDKKDCPLNPYVFEQSAAGFDEKKRVRVSRRQAYPYIKTHVFHQEWNDACEFAELTDENDKPRFTPHCLRYSFVRMASEDKGIDHDTIRKQTGHRTDSIFSHYNIKERQDVRNMMRDIGDYINEEKEFSKNTFDTKSE